VRRVTLGAKILTGTALIISFFSATTFVVLYNSESRLTVKEMETYLSSEANMLSSGITENRDGTIDFEFSTYFLAQYDKHEPQRFFRFFPSQSLKPIYESGNAPLVSCSNNRKVLFSDFSVNSKTYRVLQYYFQPASDEAESSIGAVENPWVCLVVGIDKGPYQNLVAATLFSIAPVFGGMLFLTLALLWYLVRRFTSDLSGLRVALEKNEFRATYAFPDLPQARTIEVDAINSKLHSLHRQAAQVYQEMWLFMGRAAHQLKTPVTAINATIDVLLRKERSRDELLLGLGDIQFGIKQLVSLTEKLLSSSRIAYQLESRSDEFVVISLQEFFSEQVAFFRARGEQRRVTLEILPSPAAYVRATRALLLELFGNLLENAIIYTVEDSAVEVRWLITEYQVVVSITDCGSGFSIEALNHIFDPFVRGDERLSGGSGLGLSIANRVAQGLEGEIRVASSGTQGSEIKVTLPLSEV
jgi:signal transduction histidine kinase